MLIEVYDIIVNRKCLGWVMGKLCFTFSNFMKKNVVDFSRCNDGLSKEYTIATRGALFGEYQIKESIPYNVDIKSNNSLNIRKSLGVDIINISLIPASINTDSG